ncbi:MAG: hypothetical protein GY732_13445 [Gammaproteobacteria bacterium]|nr:hypothetical protein [Gammaproteobacteria bacterium]
MCADETSLDIEDQAEIDRLTDRAKKVSRREALSTTGRALTFIVPALATFTVSPDALGQAASAPGKAGMGKAGGGKAGGKM